MKGLDTLGIALILLSAVLLLAFGGLQPDTGLGGYSIYELGPVWPAVLGVGLVVIARFRK